MKMTVKQKERVIRVLEVLKSQGLVVAYRIDGDEIGSVVLEWPESGVERVYQEVIRELRPFGLRQTDRGWLVLLLPKEWREKATAALFGTLHQTLLRMGKHLADSASDRFHAESQKTKDDYDIS